MKTVLARPGSLYVGKVEDQDAIVLADAAAGWATPKGIRYWESEVTIIARDDITDEVRAKVKATFPEEQIPPAKLPLAFHASSSSPFVAVSRKLIPDLVALGIRAHTIGADRTSSGFFYFAEGGKKDPVRVQGDLLTILSPSLTGDETTALIEQHLDSLIDRLLLHLSDGTITEIAVELAASLPRLNADGTGLEGVDLDAFEREAQEMVKAGKGFEKDARIMADRLQSAPDAPTVEVPLFGIAKREPQFELTVEIEGEKVKVPRRARWVVKGEPMASAPSIAPAPVAAAAPAAAPAASTKVEVAKPAPAPAEVKPAAAASTKVEVAKPAPAPAEVKPAAAASTKVEVAKPAPAPAEVKAAAAASTKVEVAKPAPAPAEVKPAAAASTKVAAAAPVKTPERTPQPASAKTPVASPKPAPVSAPVSATASATASATTKAAEPAKPIASPNAIPTPVGMPAITAAAKGDGAPVTPKAPEAATKSVQDAQDSKVDAENAGPPSANTSMPPGPFTDEPIDEPTRVVSSVQVPKEAFLPGDGARASDAGARPAAGEKPAEAKPSAEKPAEAKPAAEKPAEAKPAAEKPAEAKPAAEKPAEAKPAAAKDKAIEKAPATTPKEAPPASGGGRIAIVLLLLLVLAAGAYVLLTHK